MAKRNGVMVYLDELTLERLRDLAAAERRSLSQAGALCLERGLEKEQEAQEEQERDARQRKVDRLLEAILEGPVDFGGGRGLSYEPVE